MDEESRLKLAFIQSYMITDKFAIPEQYLTRCTRAEPEEQYPKRNLSGVNVLLMVLK